MVPEIRRNIADAQPAPRFPRVIVHRLTLEQMFCMFAVPLQGFSINLFLGATGKVI